MVIQPLVLAGYLRIREKPLRALVLSTAGPGVAFAIGVIALNLRAPATETGWIWLLLPTIAIGAWVVISMIVVRPPPRLPYQ
jgi:hypothetical protein